MFANKIILSYIRQMTREHLLRTVADPDGTLPEVKLEHVGRSIDQDIYAAISDDEHIGTMKLGPVKPGESFIAVQGSGVDERLKGRGYGLAMYLGAAALAYDSGHRLMSDVMVSRDAARLWGRLERHGFARIWTPFQWRGSEQYSHRGHALFVPAEELPLPDSVRRMEDNADIWQNM